MQYHIEIFQRLGIDELVLGVGHHHKDIAQGIVALGAQDFVRTVFNENYEEGNIVNLWTVRDELNCGEQVLLMDADVLYDEDMLDRLINSPHPNCFLLDRACDPGDEPVKLCTRGGEIVEFRKWLSAEFDFCGESVSFFKLSTEVAKKIIIQTEHYWRQDRRQEPYEEAIRDALLTSPRNTFAFEEVTNMPWIEIDFAPDIERANTVMLHLIQTIKEKLAVVFMDTRDIEPIVTQTL
jgi:choline kinase